MASVRDWIETWDDGGERCITLETNDRSRPALWLKWSGAGALLCDAETSQPIGLDDDLDDAIVEWHEIYDEA